MVTQQQPTSASDSSHYSLLALYPERERSALAKRDLKLIYSIAGPAVLHMLLAARVLRRRYLTTVLRVIGGEDYATMTHGARLKPPYDFRLAALYLDPAGGPGETEQLLQVFEESGAEPQK